MIFRFEWDEEKNALNKLKHGVSFEIAKMVFFDPKRIEVFDWKHSIAEERWKVIGISGFVPLIISCTERNNSIRIISARKANKNEEKEYFYGYSTSNSN